MPQNPQKTKGEILSELESIKDLLIEEDDIPILQEVHLVDRKITDHASITDYPTTKMPGGTQTSIFDELDEIPVITDITSDASQHRSTPKALGENPFLPQHIRARLHGNNPPPIFDFSATSTATKSTGKIETRHDLINELLKKFLPQIEQELRLKLLTMTEDELRRL
jgi:hypothetical protein